MHDTNLLEDQPIAWTPSPEVIERAQLTRFMKQVGMSTWDELYAFSIRDVEKFTEEVLKFLDIKFDPPYEKLLDLSNGVEFPNWFGRNADTPVRHEGEGNADTPVRQGEARKGWHSRGYLPHFDGKVTQFITFRLADSLPQSLLHRLSLELEHEKPQDPSKEYRKRVEEYLDQGIGECLLKHADTAEIVIETILREHDSSCKLIGWVIMPNHVHLLLRPLEGHGIPGIMKRIKGISARRINKLLGREGSVWQPDYFDRYIRDAEHFGKTLRYIENNPVKARLCSTPEEWRFSSRRNADTPVRNEAGGNADTPVRNEGRFGPNEPLAAGQVSQLTAASPEEPAIADKSVRVPGLNITEMCLDRWQTDEMKDQPAVIWEDEDEIFQDEISYEELWFEVDCVANGLRRDGFVKGDAIGIHLPMMVETVVSLLAIGRIGAIAVPVFSGYGIEAISSRLNAVGAKSLITCTHFSRRGKKFDSLSIANAAVAACPSIVKAYIVSRRVIEDLDFTGLDERFEDYFALGGEDPIPRTVEPTTAEDPLIILYTSGTTGKPKGIAHTHASFPIKAAQDMAFGTDVGKGTRISWYTDIGWMMGPWLIYGALINGATICIYDGAPDYPTPDRMWEFCAKHKVEVLGISPTLVRSLAAHEDSQSTDIPVLNESKGNADTFVRNEGRFGPNDAPASAQPDMPTTTSPEEPAIADKSVHAPFERHDLSALRLFASTGEPWNPAPWWWLFEKVGNSKLPIINYSGGTEISGGILMGNPLLPQKPCSFPAPCPGMDVDILDENGQSVGPNEVGELVIKQPWIGMARGFWQENDRYLETYWSRFKNIWVHGDWAMRDSDGHYFILGRSDDTLKVAGKRVGPAEVESLLVAHPLVVEAAVIGVPDEVKGTAMVAFCVLRSADTPVRNEGRFGPNNPLTASPEEPAIADKSVRAPLEAELKALVAKDMGKPLAPSKIHFVAALPKTRNAKVMRRVLRSAYLGEDPGDLSALENPNSVHEIANLKK